MENPRGWFAGSPQTLTADYLLEGATGGVGPRLRAVSDRRHPHPEFLLPAYYNGRNLAESYYLSIRR